MDSKKSVMRNIEWKIQNFTKELAIEGNRTSTSNFEISYGNKVIKGCFNGYIQHNRFYVDPIGDFASDCVIQSYTIKLHNHYWKKTFLFQKSILLDTIFFASHLFLEDNTLTILIEAEFIDGHASVVSDSNHNPIFRNYFKDKSFRDFTIYCSDGSEFPTHRFILATASQVLKRMLKCGSDSLKVDDINGATMSSILQYIYTDDIFDIRCNTAGLLYGAEKFGLEGLKTRCAKFLVKYLSVERAVDCFVLADKFDMKYTLIRCARFINSNYEAVVAHPNWSKLDNRQLMMLLGFYHENLEKVLYFESTFIKTESV